MERTTDMTKGNPGKLILGFAFPLIITNLGQQLYMMVDAAIVGRGVGVKALAAVGSADWIYWLILWTVIGITQAFSTFISRYFGDKNYKLVSKTIAMSAMLCAVISVIVTIVGVLAARPVLKMLDTPSDIIDGASIYLTTMIAGTPVIAAYNMSSAVLRSFGDGRSPLIAMLISAFANVFLDLLFVMNFHWGVFGAALASVISQMISFVYCLIRIRDVKCISLEKNVWKPDFSMMKEMLTFAVSLSMQYVVISVGGIILQSTINLQGSIFVAGYTAVNKLYGLLECTAISLGSAFATYFGQNYGAGEKKRFTKGMSTAVKMCIIAAIIVMGVVFVFGKYLLMLFLDASDKDGMAAMEIGWNYLRIMGIFLIVLYLIHVYRNAFQSMGIAFWSFVSGLAEFVIRVSMGKLFIHFFGTAILYCIEPAAWFGALALVIIPYYIYQKKYLL